MTENTNNEWDDQAAEDILAEIFGTEKLDGVERIRLEENLAKMAGAIKAEPKTLEESVSDFGVSPKVVARIKEKLRSRSSDSQHVSVARHCVFIKKLLKDTRLGPFLNEPRVFVCDTKRSLLTSRAPNLSEISGQPSTRVQSAQQLAEGHQQRALGFDATG